uniref:Uncharacterized protein n=1 Tax=Tanacetum cinerariifolium TaxID=118510 RepID=A0A6L2JAD7_TANCI|nr:hypothetical protein [Tanacetum cinerariifolium]
MDSLSLVSKYLNGMEGLLDDGDFLEARKLTVGKIKEKLKLFEALGHKSVIVNEGSHRVVVFKKAPPRAYSKPFTRFFLPCDVDGQGVWDAELDMADSSNYITEERFDQLGFVRLDYGKYRRKMVKEVHVEIYGFTILVDFVVIGYANKEMRIDLTMLDEMKDIDVMLDALVEKSEKVGSSNGDLVKTGKASRNKRHNVNKLTPHPQIKIKEIPPISSIVPPSPIYHPLTQKQKEKVKEALDRKYKELEESKPILEVLENYMTYRKKLDEVLMGRARLSRDDYGEEANMRIVEHGLPKKWERMSMLPYYLFKNLGLGYPKPYNSNFTMAGNTQAKAMGEVKNVRIQIEYQAYLVDFLILDIQVDKEHPLLLGHPFLRTYGAVIEMGRSTLCIDDGVIHHTYFPKPRGKDYLDNFAQEEEEDDWLSYFEVGSDEDGNPKYGPVAPSFLDIKDDMERALAMEAYFNPFKNIIVFKKLVDFLEETVKKNFFSRKKWNKKIFKQVVPLSFPFSNRWHKTVEGSLTPYIQGPVTADEKIQKKNDVKARSMLLMALLNEHLMTFNQYKDATSLFDAITTRFGGNDATKRLRRPY